MGEKNPLPKHSMSSASLGKQLPRSVTTVQVMASPLCACQACEKEGEESEPQHREEKQDRAPS